MKTDALDNQEDDFWKKVSNAKTEKALIYMILSELRECDLNETNSSKMNRLAKMKAWCEMLDIESIYKKSAEIVDADEELSQRLSDDY
jgi:hypothetical protein